MRKIDFLCESDYKRLDVCISENTSLTRSHAQKLIDSGAVCINQKVCTKSSQSTKIGDCVVAILPDEIPLDLPAQNIPLDIVYQDESLVVINKPQGMTVHPANNVYQDTLVNALLFHIKDLSGINGVLRPGIVHRLDKDTSGLLVVAKNDASHVNLQQQIQTKQCRRIYYALLEGVLKQHSGVVDQPIGRSKSDRKKMDVVADGRNAVTHFEVVEVFRNYTLCKFELKTGRTHQIRVHAKFLGHPIVGDKAYGYKHCKWNLAGQLLHAETLSFCHPQTGQEMSFSAPLPTYFQQILNSLRNQNK
ncbi:MAG: RluA family pseudouridine synthase [Clostridia bacterium]|nr:RluA family pseudouridine synthase [Clostridia bacterium]